MPGHLGSRCFCGGESTNLPGVFLEAGRAEICCFHEKAAETLCSHWDKLDQRFHSPSPHKNEACCPCVLLGVHDLPAQEPLLSQGRVSKMTPFVLSPWWCSAFPKFWWSKLGEILWSFLREGGCRGCRGCRCIIPFEMRRWGGLVVCQALGIKLCGCFLL